MNFIEWRTKISTLHINYLMKIFWSAAVRTETKAESGLQAAAWVLKLKNHHD